MNKKVENSIYPKLKVVILCAIGVILLLFGAVFLFTQNSFITCYSISSSKAEIGDAINGITAPITALIGAGLVFYSFLAQVDANKLIQSQWQYDSFTKAFSDIQVEILNLRYTYDKDKLSDLGSDELQVAGIRVDNPPILYQGSEAIIAFTDIFELYL